MAATPPDALNQGARPKLADVAAYARVSEATVSRVLNSRPGVSARSERAVLTALDVLGYERPSRLRRAATGMVGLVVPELVNPIFPAFVQEIEAQLACDGLTPILCVQAPGGVPEDEYVEMLLDRGVTGIVFVSGLHADASRDPARYLLLRERGLPIAFVNGALDGVDVPCVSTDDRAAVQSAVRHLVNLGHTRIGLLTGPTRYTPAARKLDSFREAMRAAVPGVDVDDLIVETFFTVEGGATGAGALLRAEATAAICSSDLMALGAIRAVRQQGLNVPDDFSIVGFDDSPMIAFTDPPLTTLRQNVHRMSEAIVTALRDEIDGGATYRGEHLFTPELIVRGSTGRPRA